MSVLKSSKARQIRSHYVRRNVGNVLSLVVLFVLFFLLPLTLAFSTTGFFLINKSQAQDIVEAAAVVAANDLSRIVINDSHFGFVALSNYPAIGQSTCAPDGEPLPVIGINTLVATVRQNWLIARQLKNRAFYSFVREDKDYLDKTVDALNVSLSACLDDTNEECFSDIHGDIIDPVASVRTFLQSNLPENMELESIKLSNGWLNEGGTTTVALPIPHQYALVGDYDSENDCYKPFVDIPVDNCSFSFAGLGSTSCLVDPSQFQESDGEHICTIVKVACTIRIKDHFRLPFGRRLNNRLECVACCQPYTLPDLSMKGAMTIRFSGGLVPGLDSWRDLLSDSSFVDRQSTVYDICRGDYPLEHDARMKLVTDDFGTNSQESKTSHQFAEHLYYWLRNGRTCPHIGAFLEMMNQPFQYSCNSIYIYQFLDDGNISRQIVDCDSFPIGVTADAQSSAMSVASISAGLTPVFLFRDNVKRLGTKYGGKHSGQPLAGYPLSIHELKTAISDEVLASRFSKRTIYGRGLAVDIEIGGTRASSAAQDVTSMRKLSRRI